MTNEEYTRKLEDHILATECDCGLTGAYSGGCDEDCIHREIREKRDDT